MAARKRGTVLQLLSRNFTRHAVNTTRYNFRSNVIYWRIEWIFPNVETGPLKFVDEKCSEQTKLSHLLAKYLNPDVFEGSKSLAYYRSAGFSGVKILLRAEKVKGSAKKFFELDPSESLSENLSGKCIVEFPIIFIVLKDHAYNFDIIIPEDEFGYDNDKRNNSSCLELNTSTEIVKKAHDDNNLDDNYKEGNNDSIPLRKRCRPLLTEKIAEQKKRAIEEEIKKEKRKKPKNLLFTTGYSSEDSLESDIDYNDT